MKKENTMRLLSILLSVLMVFSMIPVAAVFAETAQAPDATVSELGPMTLTAEEHNYVAWPSGDNTVDRPLNVVVNFKANDTLEEAQASKYAKWKTDFYLKVDGLAGDSIIADDCYLAGNYGEYPWIVIPTDGFELKEGVEYPIVSNYDSNLTYENICDYVKNFTAAIYISDDILEANPDFKVTLTLKMVNPEDENDILVLDEPVVYTASKLQGLPNAIVTELDPMTLLANGYKVWQGGSNLADGTEDLALDAVVNFKTEDTLAYAQASKYAKWKTDFYLKVEGLAGDSIIADDCYLAGNYGEYPWIVIPTDGLEIKEGEEYPVVSNYDPNLTYENICDYVKDFTAAIYIADDIVKANPDLKITLTLKMVNPDDENDVLVLDEPVVYTIARVKGLPNAIVTELEPITLPADGHKVWEGGNNLSNGTEDLPLDIVVNFKTNDTLEYAKASKYAKWKTDFYLKAEDLASNSITADDSYLAGNYGEYPWIVISTDGFELKEGIEYPIVSNYDPNLTYENICDYVKNFTAAIHIDQAIINANPDMKVTLTLKLTNPEDENDVYVVDEPVVYTFDDFTAVAVNEETGKKYADLTLALNEAAYKNQTVRVLKDIDLGNVSSLMVPAGVVLDINGKTIKSNMFMMLASFGDIIDSTQGEGGIVISNTTAYTVLSTNTYLPVYDSANGCYRFFKYNVITKGAKLVDNETNRLKFGFKLEIDSKKAYELLANDAANTGLDLTVGLTVNKGDGKPSKFDYKCSSDLLKNYAAYIVRYYDDFASGAKQTSVTFTVAGLDKLPTGTVISAIPSFSSPKTQVAKSGESVSFTK